LLGRYPAGQMAYYRGLPLVTWYSLGLAAFLLLILFILGTKKERRPE
jgi:ubiquinone biosynthesis protein